MRWFFRHDLTNRTYEALQSAWQRAGTKRCGSIRNLEVHHLTDRKTDPSRELDPENLQTLCKACHTRVGRVNSGEGRS